MANTTHSRFEKVAESLAGEPQVTRETRKGFGSGALKVKGKIFAMVSSKEEFVVKLPKARVDELVRAGVGVQYEPGPGRLMKEWLAVDGKSKRANWLELAREAYRFVRGKT